MAVDSFNRRRSVTASPRILSLSAIAAGGLGLFVVVASQFLVFNPIISAFHDFLLGAGHLRVRDDSLVIPHGNYTGFPNQGQEGFEDRNGDLVNYQSELLNSLAFAPLSLDETQEARIVNSSVYSDEIKTRVYNDAPASLNLTLADPPLPSSEKFGKGDWRRCDLYHGKWIYDPVGPLYTNGTCPILTQKQNCQGNGRPDKEYENWRWKPDQCDLPRFDARKFLELLRGKTLAFVGDSVARNQMESILCILWQVETPKKRGTHRMQRWIFRSTATTIIRIWSSWLVHKISEPFQSPQGVVKVYLDIPDEAFMKYLPRFNVLVISSGHWFGKKSVYIVNNSIVGGQLWHPKRIAHKMPINNVKALGISTETALNAIASHPNYSGLTILRSYSPDHYEGGQWNSGGSCTGKVRPASELVRNGFTDAMHEKQVASFNRAAKKVRNGSRMRLMDITEAFGYRHDGHPGPYRSREPTKVTRRGPDGRPPPQDCLHWCMPGPVDTLNEILFEIIRRESRGLQD